MIARERHLGQLESLLVHHPVVAILGARQVGKTTLAQALMARAGTPATRFDLEDPDDLARLEEAKLTLAPLTGLVVIDEIQRRPDLFPLLRVLSDRPGPPARFLILGSASRDLLHQSSESLAGRIVYHPLDGFALDEVGMDHHQRLWRRGGFPRAFLAPSEGVSGEWRRAFIQTFLERDLPQLGVRIPATTLHRFWRMVAHSHGNVWKGAEIARSLAISGATVRRYLDLLTDALVVRQLPPWHENLRKRQVKSPKVYIADSGLLHALLGVESTEELESHPKVGASWEGFVLQQAVIRLGARPEECFSWATHTGAELDLLVVRGERRIGVEIKRTTAPRLTRSMHTAREALRLSRLYVIHGGEHTFRLADDVLAIPLVRLLDDLPPL